MNVVEVVNQTRTTIDEELVARLVAGVLEAEGVAGAEVAVTFVGEIRMRERNRDHRGRDEVTDVLSFPLEEWEPVEGGGESDDESAAQGDDESDEGGDGAGSRGDARAVAALLSPDLGEVAAAVVAGTAGPPLLLGDVVVCARRALRQARSDDRPPSLEVAALLAHGTLHLLGYDHETDAGQMLQRQAEVLQFADWEGLVVEPSR